MDDAVISVDVLRMIVAEMVRNNYVSTTLSEIRNFLKIFRNEKDSREEATEYYYQQFREKFILDCVTPERRLTIAEDDLLKNFVSYLAKHKHG